MLKWDTAIGVELKVTCLLSRWEFYRLRYQDLYRAPYSVA